MSAAPTQPSGATLSANQRLALALGVETDGLCKLVLTLAPRVPPTIEATYLIREASKVSECVCRLELVCGPAEPAASPITNRKEAGDAV